MGARPRPLSADKVSVRCRDRPLARPHRFTIGGKAHRATVLTPLKSSLGEYPVESFGNGLAFDVFRSGDDPSPHPRCHLSAPRDLGCGAQVAKPAVRT